MQVYMHVNYLEGLFSIDEICRRAADAGFDGIELRGFDNGPTPVPLDEYIKSAGASAARAGLRLVFGCPNKAGSEDAALRQASLNNLRLIMRVGADFGVQILNVFADTLTKPDLHYYEFEVQGSALADDAYRQRVADYFRSAGDDAARHGIRLCFETHNNYLHDLATPTLDLLQRIDHPHVQVNLDIGNIVLNGNNLGMKQEIELLKGHIGYVHLKNMQWTRRSGKLDLRGTPLALGDINHWHLLSTLIDAGYRGPWAIENIMPGDKRDLLIEDQAYLRRTLREIALRTTRPSASQSRTEPPVEAAGSGAAVRAGAGSADFTPPPGLILQGHYNNNPSHRVLAPLEARAVVIESSSARQAIVTLDVIGVEKATTQRIRSVIERRCGVPAANVLITTSHTHCAPASLSVLAMTPDAHFIQSVEDAAVRAVLQATQRLEPAQFAVGSDEADFHINRRPLPGTAAMTTNFGGVIDRRVRVLRINSSTGKPLAVLFHFSCHPTSLSGSDGVVSPDYPGFARQFIEADLHCPALFIPGCFGNIRPHFVAADGGFTVATEAQMIAAGRQLAAATCRAARAAGVHSTQDVASASVDVAFPFEAPPAETGFIEMTKDLPEMLVKQVRKVYDQGQKTIAEQGAIAPVSDEIQAMAIGPVVLAALPGEVVQEIGFAVERSLRPDFPGRDVWACGYSNGMLGYLVTEQHKSEGGYEPNAFLYFGKPARYDNEERHLVEGAKAAAQLLK